MQRDEFERYLSLYGSEVEGWPEAIRGEALTLMGAHPDLKKRVEEEINFEISLRTSVCEEPASDLADRILRASKRDSRVRLTAPRERVSWSSIFQGLLWKPAYVFAAIFVVGLTVGYLGVLDLSNGADVESSTFLYQDEDIL